VDRDVPDRIRKLGSEIGCTGLKPEHGRGGEKELRVEVRALMEAQQLRRRLADAQHPARYESRVVGEEAMLATFVGANVAEPVHRPPAMGSGSTAGRAS